MTNLADTLFSSVRQKILSMLYLQPDNSFYTNEIIRLTQAGTGSVQRELKTLNIAGLINVHTIGNQKHYSANKSSLLYTEIRGIVLKTFGLADVLRQALSPVLDQIEIAFIYGSIAKGEHHEKSDIDLMLISDNLTYIDIFNLLVKAEEQLGRTINPTFYAQNEWIKKLKAKNNFVAKVLEQSKIFLKGNENELEKFGKSGSHRTAESRATQSS